MLTMAQLLEPLAERRRGEVVVTSMSSVRPWGRLSQHQLDFASADSAMGHAADLALGIALARPDRRVICLNGDGSMAMSLGTLLTVSHAGVGNYALIVLENGTYEITGNQAVPGAGRADLAAMALAAGFPHAWRVDNAAAWRALVDDVFMRPGPLFFTVALQPGDEKPLKRSPTEDTTYLKPSLAESSRAFRAALMGSAVPAK
jgi:thiamine pyrophosphate-dependent acetolactate synthase large subunit-like protein